MCREAPSRPFSVRLWGRSGGRPVRSAVMRSCWPHTSPATATHSRNCSTATTSDCGKCAPVKGRTSATPRVDAKLRRADRQPRLPLSTHRDRLPASCDSTAVDAGLTSALQTRTGPQVGGLPRRCDARTHHRTSLQLTVTTGRLWARSGRILVAGRQAWHFDRSPRYIAVRGFRGRRVSENHANRKDA